MTTDPSSTPDPGDRSDPDGPVVPDQDLVKELLEQMGLRYIVDEDGDLGALWEQFRMYFVFRGEVDEQTFAIRTFYDRLHPIELKPKLLEVIDDWNRRTLWPKIYSHTGDDGTVTLVGETSMPVSTGVWLGHFVSSTVSWIRAAIEFDEWLVEHLGLAADLDDPDES